MVKILYSWPRAAYDASARLEAMDSAGVQIAALFPSAGILAFDTELADDAVAQTRAALRLQRAAFAPTFRALTAPIRASAAATILSGIEAVERDAAILAIKQGWGGPTNQPGLVRILENTGDSALRRDISAALDRIGN